MNEPYISVGIVLKQPAIPFLLGGEYRHEGNTVTGSHEVTVRDGRICWRGECFDELVFSPVDPETAWFELPKVTIGIGFHWQRDEAQRFRGSLHILVESGLLTAVDVLPVEEYLKSVISSEMSATASLELLKAHAVISRSWLLAQLDKTRRVANGGYVRTEERDGEFIRWYDREDHDRFDVCADDHCQRYQGITRSASPRVTEAVEATRGELLMYGGAICDARFSKCCGGAFEEFPSCWEPAEHPYLKRGRDWHEGAALPVLTDEATASRWIYSRPDSFCHTDDRRILSQVLNSYDFETTDFYRWRVSYTRHELSEIVRDRSGLDFGEIVDLVPVERGVSGRLIRLRIVGTLRTLTIGKELEIRRTLSRSHLYSSAFVVEKHDFTSDGKPGRFVLHGAGWGHGVGLCQIGAAVMGEQGYRYDEILRHYFPGAELAVRYK